MNSIFNISDQKLMAFLMNEKFTATLIMIRDYRKHSKTAQITILTSERLFLKIGIRTCLFEIVR